MPRFVKMWMEGLGKTRDNGIPVEVGTAGMDQVSTSGVAKAGPQPFDTKALEELAEIKRKLTGRPESEEMTDKERAKLEKRRDELQDLLRLSPDAADATYGLTKVPTTSQTVDVKPSDIDNDRS